MDGITQGLLGAAVGQAAAGSKLPRRAVWWGALAGILPDFDFFGRLFSDDWSGLWMHRGITHSLWFGWVVGPLLGYGTWQLYRWRARMRSVPGEPFRFDHHGGIDPGGSEARNSWMLVFSLGLFTHPLLDVFTSYGTQLLAPFYRARFVFDGVGIIDPAYSLTLLFALLWARLNRAHPGRGLVANRVALASTTAYLLVGVWLSQRVEALATRQLESSGHEVTRVDAYTSVFQIGLKRVVAHTPGRTWIGYASGWKPTPIYFWSFSSRVDPIVSRTMATEHGRLFGWFADGQLAGHVTRSPSGVRVEIDDVRYGYPGTPDLGMWGIRGEYDPAGRLLSLKRIHRPRTIPSGAVGNIFRAAFGYEPEHFLVGVGPAPPPPKTTPGQLEEDLGRFDRELPP